MPLHNLTSYVQYPTDSLAHCQLYLVVTTPATENLATRPAMMLAPSKHTQTGTTRQHERSEHIACSAW